MGIVLRSWFLVSLMKEPLSLTYATECLTVMSPDSKSTSHQRRPQTSPMRIPVCRASTTALLKVESDIIEVTELSFGTRSERSAFLGLAMTLGARAPSNGFLPIVSLLLFSRTA